MARLANSLAVPIRQPEHQPSPVGLAGIEVRNRPTDIRFIWLATAILLASAAFRLVLLSDVPPGLSQDEVLNADVAAFILEGEHALFFPYGFGHEPLFHYWAAPFQLLLGDNILAIRLPTVFLGLVLIALTMRWAKRDFGTLAALIAGVGLAISWWAIAFSRVGIRPVLEAVLLISAIWAWPVNPWIAGALLGLAIYSYTAARYIFLLPMGMVLYLLVFHRRGQTMKRAQQNSFRSIRTALIVLLVSFAFFVPLFLTLRADPTLQQRVEQLSGPLEALRRGDFEPILTSLMSTLGAFSFTGDPRWTYSTPGRPVFDPLTALLFYGGLGIVLWRWRRPVYALLLIWLTLTLLPSALTPDAPSTIRLIGLMPLVYLLPGIFLSFLWSRWQVRSKGLRARQRTSLRLIGLLLLVILGLNIWRTIDNGFVVWPQAMETRIKYQTVIQDMARHWKQQGKPQLVVADAYFEPIDADSLRRIVGHDPGARWIQMGPSVAGAIVVPADDVAAQLYVPEFAPLTVALLEATGMADEPNYRSTDSPSFAVYELTGIDAIPTNSVSATLDDKITFLGYSPLEMNEKDIKLITYWRVESVLPDDLASFVHLLDPKGAIVAQHDGLDVAPHLLRAGDQVLQYHTLPLPGDLPDGPYTLQTGMYRRGDTSRLLRLGDPADRIILSEEVTLTYE